MNERRSLEITGSIRHAPLVLDRETLAAFPASAQVPDVGALVPGRAGRGVRLSAIVARAAPESNVRFVNIQSADPKFAVSVPIGEVLEHGIVVYELDGAPLAAEKGGPFRLLVCGHADECVNVKQLARLEFTPAAGRDTRPADDAAHRALHAKKKSAQ
jgi:2-dehydropantoate 2-reductase